MTADLHLVIDALVERFSAGAYRDDVARAKEEYLDQAGKVFDDDAELFETRMAAFLEWYVLERPLRGGETPVETALAAPETPAAKYDTLLNLAASHHSLFDIAAVAGDTVELEDVLTGARFSARERRSTVGFDPGHIVQARLLWDGERVVFGKTFLFHPVDAREKVLDQIDAERAAGKSRLEIIFSLSRMHLRWYRGGQNARRAYSE